MGNEDENRKAILARRARYIAMALAGVSTATSATACVCLEPLHDAGSDTNADAPLPDAWLPTLPDSRGPVWPSTDAATDAPEEANDAHTEADAPTDSDAP